MDKYFLRVFNLCINFCWLKVTVSIQKRLMPYLKLLESELGMMSCTWSQNLKNLHLIFQGMNKGRYWYGCIFHSLFVANSLVLTVISCMASPYFFLYYSALPCCITPKTNFHQSLHQSCKAYNLWVKNFVFAKQSFLVKSKFCNSYLQRNFRNEVWLGKDSFWSRFPCFIAVLWYRTLHILILLNTHTVQ